MHPRVVYNTKRMSTKQRQTIPLTPRQAIPWIALFALLILSIMGDISPADIRLHTLMAWASLGITPLLNWLIIFLPMLCLLFATGSAAVAGGVVGVVMLVMACVNRGKIMFRGDPLLPWDLSLIGEVLGIARGFGWGLILLVVVLCAALVAGMVVLIRTVKTERMPARMRVLGVLGCLVAMLVGNRVLFSNAWLFARLPLEGTEYNQTDVHNARGNLYAFLYNRNRYRPTPPDGYDAVAVAADINSWAADAPTVPDVRPHIIMIMGEAFSDLSNHPGLDFTAYDDPLAGFKDLAADGLFGHIVVSGRGGGTADTEADVLTARPTRYLRQAPYAYRLINEAIPALPSLLAAQGYATWAMHPGYAWFYNRQNVYQHLGFEQSAFVDTFAPEDYDGYYVREDATYDRLIGHIDAHLAKAADTPLFAFCVTIENHGPYAGRYLSAGARSFDTSLPLSVAEMDELSNYFTGVARADVQLTRLAAYLEDTGKPFVLLYFGDHLPLLAERLYDLLVEGTDSPDGSLMRETRLYRTPFVLWQTAAARAVTGLDTRAVTHPLPADGTLSANYLGAYLLQLLGYDGLSPLIDYTNVLRGSYPVLMEKQAFDAAGIAHADADDPALLRLRQWVYFEANGH